MADRDAHRWGGDDLSSRHQGRSQWDSTRGRPAPAETGRAKMRNSGKSGGALLAFGAASLWSTPALAAQCATVTFSPGSVTVPAWNPISPGAQQATFTMTLTRVSTATNAIRIIFTDSNDSSQPVKLGTNGTFSGPQYQVLDPSGNNVLYPLNASVLAVK